MNNLPLESAISEKRAVALSSVLAAIFLTVFKIVVGLLTNSLGILSEAAHSGLDLVAAGVTYFAVRASDQPPDAEHTYGHYKIENLSALIETFLLLATCVWIIYEAVSRLIEPVHVEASPWSFIVMATSIIVDVSRSRALMKAAKKFNSQALEADALHFSTDVWSSAVVILGLFLLWIGQWLERTYGIQAQWLFQADAVAALGVSVIVIYVSYQLGRRTIAGLLDTAESGETEQIREVVKGIPGVNTIRQLRLRHSGPATFVDLALDVARTTSFEEAHHIAHLAEEAIAGLFSHADVVVHVNPVAVSMASLIEQVHSVAARRGVAVHGLRAYHLMDHLSLEMHLEVPEDLTIAAAHEWASNFEAALRIENSTIRDIVTHLEPVGDTEALREAVRINPQVVTQAVEHLPELFPQIKDVHNVRVHFDGHQTSLSFHCRVDPEMSITHAHNLTERLEAALYAQLPDIGRVVIHTEPFFDLGGES